MTRDPRRLAQAVALSFPLWISIATGIRMVTVAFHMMIPFTGSFLIMALLVVGVAAPTPGAVGGFHEMFRVGTAVFYGVDNDRAVGAAIVLHAASFIPVTLLGGLFMMQDGLNLARVRRLGDEARAAEGAAVPVPIADAPAGARSAGRMKCPFCGHLGDKVVDSRESREGDVIRRRRECLECARRFTSYERVDEIPYMVVKKDGRRERFERQKLIAGLLKACEKRPVSVAALEAIADRVEMTLQDRPEKEMSVADVGAFVMHELKGLDKVAYVRFASVYRHFRDVGEFMTELRDLLGAKE